MKVLWANENLQNVCVDQLMRKSGKDITLSQESSNTTLINGTMNLADKEPQIHQILEPKSCGSSRGTTVIEHCRCLVCDKDSELRTLDDCSAGEPCTRLLLECFGVKVEDPSLKICAECAALVLSSHRLKEMVCTALCKPFDDDVSQISLSDCGSALQAESARGARGGGERAGRHVRRVCLKRKPPAACDRDRGSKKTFVVCTVCRQKYPMMSADDGSTFVCSRCKLRRVGGGGERAVPCATCKVPVPARALKRHLELHAQTDLKGRCRLRSLTKKPSKALTAEPAVKKCRKSSKQVCKHCHRKVPFLDMIQHVKLEHGDFSGIRACVCDICGKDARAPRFLERHMKIHEKAAIFECKVCGKIFKTALAHQRHLNIHNKGGGTL